MIHILGVKIDRIKRTQTLEKISQWVKNPADKAPVHIVTAYSEFFVAAQKDPEFKKIINQADLVVPDGVGPLAALDYLEHLKAQKTIIAKFVTGLQTGLKILSGKIGETVSGVWLFQELVDMASTNRWKVFLLGGFGDTAEKLAGKLKKKFPSLQIAFDPGERLSNGSNLTNKSHASIEKINSFHPDLLFVAYGPVKQEKWIAENVNNLAAKVVIGVGGTFDELSGKVPRSPKWLEQMGLKWLWRLIFQPQRLPRIFNAVVVFPWLVFEESLQN